MMLSILLHIIVYLIRKYCNYCEMYILL